MFAAAARRRVPMGESGRAKALDKGRTRIPMQELPSPPLDAATPVVSAFYDRFPYPGDPLQDGPPPGYNWRWCVDSVVAAVRGALPPRPAGGGPRPWRVLVAGCGTGVSTD